MKTYRLKLRPVGRFITPLKADTLFGGLCWSLRYSLGERALNSFLDAYRSGEPPLVLSNAMPGDLFPKPFVRLTGPVSGSGSEMLDNLREAKRLKDIHYLDATEFRGVCRGERPFVKKKDPPFISISQVHNQIDRLEGRACTEGGLYAQEEWYLNTNVAEYLTVYIRVNSEYLGPVFDAFKALGRIGVGKRKSTGKGAFELLASEEFSFGTPNGVNAFISLSDFVPAKDDPTEGYYSLQFKYGKLGEEYASRYSPFKRPFAMLSAGSCFLTDECDRPYFGRMVEGVSPVAPQVLHYGLAFSVPALIRQTSAVS